MEMLHKLLMNKYFEIKVEGKSKEKEEKVVASYDLLIELENVAHKEGLIMLEERAGQLDVSDGTMRFLATLLKLIVDGTDPQVLAELGMNFIISDNFTAYDGLISLMFLQGSLMIQAGEHPRLLDVYLKSMMPESCRKIIEKHENESEDSTDYEPSNELIQQLCEGNEKLDEKDYSIINQTALALVAISDKSIQRLLRDVDNVCLVTAMKALPGIARKRIFDNVSIHLGNMLAEDMAAAHKSEAQEACYHIMKVFVKLADYGEIVGYDTSVLKVVLTIFDEANKKNEELRDKYISLKKLIDEIYRRK